MPLCAARGAFRLCGRRGPEYICEALGCAGSASLIMACMSFTCLRMSGVGGRPHMDGPLEDA